MAERITAILECAALRWRPGVGDPTVMGWATVALYLGAAALAGLVIARSGGFPPETRRRERLFWVAMLALLLVLGVNKQLDLQSALTAVGRCVAQLDGWYAERRATQARFILALLAAALAGAVAMALLLRGALWRQGPALLGMALLLGFVLARAVGFHHVDALISARVGGWRLNWILEIGGVALVCFGALWALAAARSPARPRRRRGA